MLKRSPNTLARSTFLPRGKLLKRGPVKGAAAKQAAYRVVDAGPRFCIACGGSYQLTHSHCLTQKQWPHHAANPANIVFLCMADHAIWENDKNRFAALYPEAFAQKLSIIKTLEPQAFAIYALKFPRLVS